MVKYCLTFGGVAGLFCRVAALFSHSHQQGHRRVPVCPHSCQHLLLSVFLSTVILWWGSGITVWILLAFPWFTLSIFSCAYWEHLFLCLLAICVFSLEKYLFRSFAHFSMGLSFPCWVVKVFYIFWEQVPYQIDDFSGIFSYSLSCPFTFLIAFFEMQKFLILVKLFIRFFLVCLFLVTCDFGVLSKKPLTNPGSQSPPICRFNQKVANIYPYIFS